MQFYTLALALAAGITTVDSHAVLLAAVGDKGQSQGFLVDPELARNCTTISPCQQDATIIRDNEITQNIVNACGRTEINGNIDIGEQTEIELAAGRMTQVSAGSVIAVTLHQVNADGAGPFECDMDETSNAVAAMTPLKVSNNVPGSFGLSQAKEQEFTINVQMPEKLNCIGASTGNICTVRCRNTAVAGPFGGCFAVQQTDGKGRTDKTAAGVETAQTLQGISAQILQNQKDLPAAIAANQAAGAAGTDEGAAAISALITATVNPNAGATQAPAAGNGNNGQQNGKGKGNGRGNAGQGVGNAGNQNANAGNQNANAGNQNANAGNQNANAGNQNAGAGAAAGAGAGAGKGQGRANGNRMARRSKFVGRGIF